ADDGLQHFGLPRRLQLAVFDRRGAGNGRMLPAGPLREPLSTAAQLDALLLNGTDRPPVEHPSVFPFRVMPTVLRRVGHDRDADCLPLAAFRQRYAGRRIVALAGIADPSRFFGVLDAAGIVFRPVPLPDHARLDRDWLASMAADGDGTLFVMTDKDAVKLTSLDGLPPCWTLEVTAHFDRDFFGWLTARLPAPTAQPPLLQD
ncbi:MAG: tetraacyldisaccharide 4'-kinase, partial [Burkholderiaceae bacterium]